MTSPSKAVNQPQEKMVATGDGLMQVAQRLGELLRHRDQKLVLAESCTAGLAAATVARIPGASDYLCGGFVVYRSECKEQWLGISRHLLEQHTAVSPQVTRELAVAALERTPSADLAGAITGHLGPQAPENCDGQIYLALAVRHKSSIHIFDEQACRLRSAERAERQQEAAQTLLTLLADRIEEPSSIEP